MNRIRPSHSILRRGTTAFVFLTGLLLVLPSLIQSPNVMIFAQEPLPKLSEAEMNRQIQKIPNWTIEDQQLRCTYEFKDFVEAVAFVNRLVEPAESASHHPDITVSYNRVGISLTTHDAGGITQKDFDLAQVISQIAAQL